MKTISMTIMAAALALSGALAATQPACENGTLESYEALENGCTIGEYAFENWTYTAADNNIPASAINVTPTVSNTKPGFTLSVATGNAETWELATGQSYNGTIRITAQQLKGKLAFQDVELSLSGGQFEGGELLVTLNGCLRAIGVCAEPRDLNTGIPISLSVPVTPGTETASFPGSTETVDAYINIVLQGPSSGSLPTGFSTLEVVYTLGDPPAGD